ncbi:GH36-type glycosyl hydrolase domain-containing protein [Derxia lacustris]|uniref:GH36-type glycosyl hydrolase domain-containing protein n=1 Tax=Derxia lacustris TaxID=764842 RepID=UPI000A16FCB6|nr:glucoamylase family protein [Derxia lacustris]
MKSIFVHAPWMRPPAPPWNDRAPVRQELFGVERLEQHAASLAAAQRVTARPRERLALHHRLATNAAVLLAAYRASAAALDRGETVVPAAEWLLDNYHVVEEQIRKIRDDLPPGYYRQLPKLADGPFVGYPRVLGLAWAFVAHTDSHFDPDTLLRFIAAYQRVQPLTIGELWAVAITLRVVLVENLRRLTDQISVGRAERAEADALADRLLAPGGARSALERDIASRDPGPLSELFAAQLAKRLRDQDPRSTPALGWLRERLAAQGLSIDDTVRHAQQRQGASNVTVRNVITSMRLISDVDWAELFEAMSLVDARLRAGSDFAAMDLATRNLYRSAIEQLARGSSFAELDIADLAVKEAARAAAGGPADPAQALRASDPGYHLIAEGRRALELIVGFRAPLRLDLRRWVIRLGIGGYVGALAGATAALLALALTLLAAAGVAPLWLAGFALLAALPAGELATALVNRAVTRGFGPVILPGLDLAAGVPPALRTLVAVPTLLGSETELMAQIERLEVHYLSGAGGDLSFALLVDGLDAATETVAADARLLALAADAFARLNRRHGPGPDGDRFLLLHRRRQFNPSEGCWMGWERKRGKLHELNRLLRGAGDTSFVTADGQPPRVPAGVRFVVTLDADTRLPRDAVTRLIGKLAHPLNRPRFDAAHGRVTGGHAILQPRVTPALPVGREGSLFQRLYSGPSGIDPYAAAISDVYQDLFGEGSYTGKGIYDIDAFEAALAGRVPDNRLLSHDLFEGIFARAGLVTDVEVVEEFPSRIDVAARRQQRWTRGDWQLLPWIAGRRARGVPAIGRWKMADNLRRSLLAPATLAALAFAALLPQAAPVAVALLLATLFIPPALPLLDAVLPHHAGVRPASHLRAFGADLRLAGLQAAFALAFLADQAWRALDAIARTLARLFVSHRHLLEWTTAAQSGGSPRLSLRGFQRRMAGGSLLALGLAGGALLVAPAAWPLLLPLAALWLAAPALALHASRSPPVEQALALLPDEALELRLIARRTWRYFETFVTPADNHLPPDNFQEDPRPAIAHRTSPTNIGLYLLSAVAARDFGWTGSSATVERLEATFATLDRLARHRGHFFNWIDTLTLDALAPAYVSSVDSGNLAGHLIVLANACDEWRANPRASAALAQAGRADALALAERSPDPRYWHDAAHRSAAEHSRDEHLRHDEAQLLAQRLASLAARARAFALAMDFAFLLDRDRKLLSIGYSAADNRLDPSCYDLLASEARLASLFAIAKGDAATKHWFRLGRAATPLGKGSALISWSGSMFEYLMPSLVMRAPAGSLLEQTNRLVVARQQDYGRALGIPWGVSESAFNARDIEFTYQYSNFGVPGLGLKRGLAENIVIAPYATGLATMVDPRGALRNFAAIAALGGDGRHGFHEALDFTRSRLPDDVGVAVVRSYMAHHQGMTLVAIANTLLDGGMRARFHREPMIQACELLLHERMPRDVAIARPRAEEMKVAGTEANTEPPTLRRLNLPLAGAPATHLLSNGRYAVMLTATGGGYSRWRDMAITRWREDPTCDDWGAFIFARDVQSGAVWSTAAGPLPGHAEPGDVAFAEDHAEFTRRDASLVTTMEVIVSGEDDGEVRRVSLVNSGRRTREIELTSYAEIVLATPASDDAHPAFSKLFVQTEHLAEADALIATRRPRSADEPRIWAAHFTVVEGQLGARNQHETDRARFIGRGRTPATSAAIADGVALSGSVGSVLDPIFALRRRVLVPPGQAVRVAFWTVAATTREALLDLIDRHQDRSAFDRAKTLAWTQAQVQLRHLDVEAPEAADFQRLAAPILYADRRFRAPPTAIARGAGPQSGLWPQSISGDLPIVLLRIDEAEDIAQVRQLLRAHEYWRLKRLGVDLVIVNERASSYTQELQGAIETAVRSSQSRPRLGEAQARGQVFTLRADLMSVETRALLLSVARVVLVAHRGPIANQLAALPPVPAPAEPADGAGAGLLARSLGLPGSGAGARRNWSGGPPRPAPAGPLPAPLPAGIEFFNGLGGFVQDGREYLTVLDAGRNTPAPWINVVANDGFGFSVSAEGASCTWAGNSRENPLTPWSNDPVTDACGDAFYLRDEASGEVWSATAQPMRDGGRHVARHGFGYSRFEHESRGIALELLLLVPLADPVRVARLTLRNHSGLHRRISVTSYVEWALGAARGGNAPFIVTERDNATGALLARNPWRGDFGSRVAFADLGGRQTRFTADRCEFLGRGGSTAAPAALLAGATLSGASGAGLDPCAALQCTVALAPGGVVEVLALLGQADSAGAARDLIARYRATPVAALLDAVQAHWAARLGAVQVRTPDRALDLMLNGWLLYQTLACRITARAAFYQASGAYGFRDQLQDGMALGLTAPALMRSHLLRAAGRQFPEGDVQHWWLPHSGQGVRTRISDDRVWLAYAAAHYVLTTGDAGVLDERLPFLDGPPLAAEEEGAFFQPMSSELSATLFEHCARGLDQCLQLSGAHGLPLMGSGDWNDGMNRVGGGRGESVWLGWLLLSAIGRFAPLAANRAEDPDGERARRWRNHANTLRAALENHAWDGAWYRRATYDDGQWLGSAASDECRIDSIAQSWAVLSGGADAGRAAQAMAALDSELVRRDSGLALLFTPPFDRTPHDPGYIKGYPPGLRENGGQYSHAAMWAVLAWARLGQGRRAAALFGLLNPINHALDGAAAERYRLEPYVVAADVYSVAPHEGRGGWSWYTGSAAWMYRAGVEGILGLRREGGFLRVAPCIPPDWAGYDAVVSFGGGRYDIRVNNGGPRAMPGMSALLDGWPVAVGPDGLRLPLDGDDHRLALEIGPGGAAPG